MARIVLAALVLWCAACSQNTIGASAPPPTNDQSPPKPSATEINIITSGKATLKPGEKAEWTFPGDKVIKWDGKVVANISTDPATAAVRIYWYDVQADAATCAASNHACPGTYLAVGSQSVQATASSGKALYFVIENPMGSDTDTIVHVDGSYFPQV